MRRYWSLTKQIFISTVALALIAIILLPRFLPKFQLHQPSTTPLSALQRDPASTTPAEECLHPPPDSCTFYADCLESRYHCGPDGYPLGYGQKYCLKFQTQRTTLSARGQTWMLATMHCLQESLVPDAIGAANATTTCAALEHMAFATHAGCYVDSGLCQLPPSDWLAVLEIVDIKTLFDSWDATKATLIAGTDCLEFFALLLGRRV
ncbi:hypothetical protein DFH07DRAFT_213308 [Mycena maculata]|uniref:Uncharacterized protein n=1 Tax=Mycena maculata TaxID=230809 RepID=A0AAD7JUC6_9AGAR|nr:hypothetical protein DFH07DRAFT_213308 [Mycena maculata]